jgi:hypothetical protein
VAEFEADPGKVFDLTLPLDQVAEGYRAMDERRAIKTLLRPDGRSPFTSDCSERLRGNDGLVARGTAKDR